MDFPMDCPDFPGHELDVRRSDGQLERQVSTLVPGTAAPRAFEAPGTGKSRKMWENIGHLWEHMGRIRENVRNI
jgi:hypothetical protein